MTPEQGRQLAAQQIIARDDSASGFLRFVTYTMPWYKPAPHHTIIAEHLEAVERGEIKRLMIEMPPRHGKSQLASRHFPAWYIGRNPTRQIITASYNDVIATDMGRDVRNLVGSQLYANVFPGVRLSDDSAAAGRWHTNHGGSYLATGVGGAMTGFGAHCIAAGQLVLTARGNVPIEHVVVGDMVFTHRLRWRRVVATKSNGVRPVVRLTGYGIDIICTPEHRLWSIDGWQEAERSAVLSCLDMRQVRGWFYPSGQVPCLRQAAEVLREQMPSDGTRRDGASAQEAVRDMRVTDAQGKRSLLLQGVLSPWCNWSEENTLTNCVRAMRRDVRSMERKIEVLHDGVQEQQSRAKHAWSKKSELRFGGIPDGLYGKVQEDNFSSDEEQGGLPGVWFIDTSCCSSHGREQAQRFTGEPCCSVPLVPRVVSQIQECRPQNVFDLQVEEDESFCVGGVFAHNCLLIDDAVKNRDEADSERMRDSMWSWYTSTALTRMMPGSAVIIIGTRWHEDDLAGRALASEKWVRLRLPAIRDEHTDHEQALWPEWYPLEDLRKIRSILPARDWAALYQQEPRAEQGGYIQRPWLDDNRYVDTPTKLNVYIASDFAVAQPKEGKQPDFTEHGVFGLAPDDSIYVLDWWHGQTSADVWIESLLDLFKKWKPVAWFGEGGVIRHAIEPFLVRRMRERRVYSIVDWLNPIKDKATHGRAFQARAAMGRVRFPQTPWADRVVDQCVGFPGSQFDDAFDAIGKMCRAIDEAHPAIADKPADTRPRSRWDKAFKGDTVAGWKTA